MSFEVTTAFVKQFGANVFHLSQQRGSRMRIGVRTETQVGESRFFDRIGAVVAQELTTRHSDTPQIDTPHSRRRVTLTDFVHADLVDTTDKLRMLMDPTSDYSKAFIWAMGRAMDDKIIDNADANAFGGKDGSTLVPHPNTQKIASVDAAAGANFNVQAWRRGKKKLDENDVDPSIRRYIAYTASQEESLLSETEITSSDFNVIKALVMGNVNTYLGMTPIRLERINLQSGALLFDSGTGEQGGAADVDADGFRKVLIWAQTGLLLSIAQDMQSEIERRADKNFSTQVFARMSIGSTRMEEKQVVVVMSDES